MSPDPQQKTVAILAMRRSRKKEGKGGSAVEDFARLDI